MRSGSLQVKGRKGRTSKFLVPSRVDEVLDVAAPPLHPTFWHVERGRRLEVLLGELIFGNS